MAKALPAMAIFMQEIVAAWSPVLALISSRQPHSFAPNIFFSLSSSLNFCKPHSKKSA